MGALPHIPPTPPWSSHDDLLLRKAVEAGASLESLAKGAVRFSRPCTIQELQDRWQALLYDPDIATQASAHMVELELSSSVGLSPSSNRVGDPRGNGISGKRKEESVRSHYYARIKRNRSERLNMDLTFLPAPNLHNCTGIGGGCEGQFTVRDEHPVENCLLGVPASDPFELNDTNFDIVHHGFPQGMRSDTAAGSVEGASHVYHNGHQDTLEGRIADGLIGENSLYEYVENVPSVPTTEAVGNDIRHSLEHERMHNDVSHVIAGEHIVFDGNSHVQEIKPPEALSMRNLFQTENVKTESVSAFDPGDNNPGIVCTGYGGNQSFNSSASDSFHQLEYSSPVWRTMEDISMPDIPSDENYIDRGAGGTVTCTDDASGFDVLHPDSHLEEKVSDEGLRSSNAMAEGGFAVLPPLLNFANEEVLLYLDDDEKETIDTSCFEGLHSLLMSSPTEADQNDIPAICEPKASMCLDSYPGNPDVPCSEPNVIDEKLHSGPKTCDSDINVLPSTPPFDPHPEYRNGVICCVLNTEDPHIPSDDDVYESAQVHSPFVSLEMQRYSKEASCSYTPSTMDFTHYQKAGEQGPSHANREEYLANSWQTESQGLAELPNNPMQASGLKPELLSNCEAGASMHTVTDGGESSQGKSGPLTAYSIPPPELKEDSFETAIEKLLEKSFHDSDHLGSHPREYYEGINQEGDIPAAIRNHMSTHVEQIPLGMPLTETVTNPSASDQEEQHPDNDEDIPYFSDIEKLILEMDLVPSDLESCFSREVLRYQNEKTKRSIIRLEQGAHSCMQRAILSHKAFAVLYGRHLKHYIKKPEVLLGRATDDFDVDIDLAKEGRANKISRQQALIKIEDDGSLCLKNLGKGPILVNSKEVAYGHLIKLSSGCLIEIKNMRFIFEISQTAVTQYLAKKSKNNQVRNLKFEWSPGVH